MTARTFRCRSCGEERVAEGSTGRLPSVCDVCDPEAAARRRYQRRLVDDRLGAIARLEARVAELEEQLAAALDAETHDREFTEAADWRRHRLGEPGREAVGRAVRELARARGRSATRAALLDVASACRAWARLIAITGEHETDIAVSGPLEEAA